MRLHAVPAMRIKQIKVPAFMVAMCLAAAEREQRASRLNVTTNRRCFTCIGERYTAHNTYSTYMYLWIMCRQIKYEAARGHRDVLAMYSRSTRCSPMSTPDDRPEMRVSVKRIRKRGRLCNYFFTALRLTSASLSCIALNVMFACATPPVLQSSRGNCITSVCARVCLSL